MRCERSALAFWDSTRKLIIKRSLKVEEKRERERGGGGKDKIATINIALEIIAFYLL